MLLLNAVRFAHIPAVVAGGLEAAPVAVADRVLADVVAVVEVAAGAPGKAHTGDLAKDLLQLQTTDRLHQLVHRVDHSDVDVGANGLNGVWTANAIDPANPCTLRCTQHRGAIVGEQTPP